MKNIFNINQSKQSEPEVKVLEEELSRLTLRRGYLVLTEFSAKGGSKSSSKKAGKDDHDVITRKYDDKDIWSASTRIISSANQIVRKYTVPTPIGYWIDDLLLPRLQAAMESKTGEAEELNVLAAQLESERRVKIALYPISFDADPNLSERILDHVLDTLKSLYHSLKTGDLLEYRAAMHIVRNLHRFVSPPYDKKIQSIVNLVPKMKKEYNKLIKAGDDKKTATRKMDFRKFKKLLDAIEKGRTHE